VRTPGRFPVGAFREDGSRHPWFDGACLVLLYEGEQILNSFDGEFGTRFARLQLRLIRCSKGNLIGYPEGKTQVNGVSVANEYELSAVTRTRDRDDLKPLPEQRMGAIGYLDDLRLYVCRVVEGGIMRGFRSMPSTTNGW